MRVTRLPPFKNTPSQPTHPEFNRPFEPGFRHLRSDREPPCHLVTVRVSNPADREPMPIACPGHAPPTSTPPPCPPSAGRAVHTIRSLDNFRHPGPQTGGIHTVQHMYSLADCIQPTRRKIRDKRRRRSGAGGRGRKEWVGRGCVTRGG